MRRGGSYALPFLTLIAVVVCSWLLHAQSGGRWYDAYAEGIKAIGRNDWVTAEQRLRDAQSTGPKPGRRVLSYGDTYNPFLPDYYLGIVYLNTGRPREAADAFARVRSLIGPKDPEYTIYQKQVARAAEEVKASETKMAQTAPPPTPPSPTPIAPPGQVVQNPPQMTEPAPTPGPGDKSAAVIPNDIKDITGSTLPYSPGTSTPLPPQSGSPAQQKAADAEKAAAVVPRKVLDPPPPDVLGSSGALQNGLMAFFSGDYRGAVTNLEIAARLPNATPRVRAILACARAGLVLTGGGDQEVLATARAEYRSVPGSLTDAQRRFISPRVLETLERP